MLLIVTLQVMKFVSNSDKPSLTLGEAFQPGSDAAHFCQPTDVAVMNSDDIMNSDDVHVYVADGFVYILTLLIYYLV